MGAGGNRPDCNHSDRTQDGGPGGNGRRILVVEDEIDVMNYVAAILRMEGYEVARTSDAQSALATLRSDTGIDLVLSDVGLPGGMDGFELGRMARSELPGLKVLFMSGHAREAPAAHEGDESHIELVAKPFSPEVLLARVKRMLDGG